MTATYANSIPQKKTERRGIFGRIFDGMVFLAESNHRVRLAEKLNGLTDKELEARGLRREDIAHHVFRGLLIA